jgi:transcriptional regulator with XRE-family HTH domain
MERQPNYLQEGQASYQQWRAQLLADPETRRIYEEEAAKKALWLQLVEARQAAGLTQQELARRLGVSQAQVARIEKRGYDAYTLTTLRRYVQALGDDFALEVTIRHHGHASSLSARYPPARTDDPPIASIPRLLACAALMIIPVNEG